MAGDALSTGPPPGLHQQAGVSPTGQPNGDHSILTPLFRSLSKMVLPCQVFTQMKLTH